MTNRERVLALVRSEPTGLTDSEIRGRTGIQPHQQVNQICRSLAQAGLIERRAAPQGRLVNFPPGSLPKNSPPGRRLAARAKSGKPSHERADPADAAEMPRLSISTTLFVLPCSGSKRRSGRRTATRGTSVLRSLPRGLAAELRTRRSENASRVKLDESALLPAAERYTGTLYQAAGDALDVLAGSGAGLLIISGGYGVASAPPNRLAGTTSSSGMRCGPTAWSRDVSLPTRTRPAPQPSSPCSQRQPSTPEYSAQPAGLTESSTCFMSGRTHRPGPWSRPLALKAKH